jgi:glycosyltransferase involved in cell wall biosynthesis
LERKGVEVSGFSPRKLLFETWDVWHLHWPTDIVNYKNVGSAMVRLVKLWLALKLARSKKIRIFWTAHELRPHERDHAMLERIFWRIFLPNVDGIICMSVVGRRELLARHPKAKSIRIFVIPHGHYRGAYPDVMSRDEARRVLKIDPNTFVAAYIGQIRPYKGIPRLIRCFTEAKIDNAGLLIAGMAISKAIITEVEQAAALDSNVKFFPGFVDQGDVQTFLRASDLVILPYIEIQNSGSAILALSFDRPVLVPAQGALVELSELVGPEWVRLYEGEVSPEIIRSAVEWVKVRQIKPGSRSPIDALGWERIAELTIQAFKN